MTLARLYGRVQGHGSLAVVTEGFRSVLEASGVLAGVCPVDMYEIPEEETHAGASARHGIYTGHLGQVEMMFKRGLHQHYWIMLAPNSNRFPPDLVHLIAGLQEKHHRRVHLMTPSAWATDVISKHFVGHQGPCITVPHGVSPEYHVRPEFAKETRKAFEDTGAFRVMHFSTSAQERKGTTELLQAWGLLMENAGWRRNSELLCVLDRHAQAAALDALAERGTPFPPCVRIVERADLTPLAMAQNLSRAHVVCQPSRGEAFGLIPLEALCCGVPVAATACTGHSEYLPSIDPESISGLALVRTGPMAPIDDLPGASAPSLDPTELAHALEYARAMWAPLQDEALRNAGRRQEQWAWKETLRPFIELLRST